MKLDIILMAAGNSRRFGQNKLLVPLAGKPLYFYLFEQIERAAAKLTQDGWQCRIFTVTRYSEILEAVENRRQSMIKKYHTIPDAEEIWQPAVDSPESQEGVSHTIRNGLKAAGSEPLKERYLLFAVADQPLLTADSIVRLVIETVEHKKGIGSLACQDEPGNPVLFSSIYQKELENLEGDRGGRRVLKMHEEDCFYCQIQEKSELWDTDTREKMVQCEQFLTR